MKMNERSGPDLQMAIDKVEEALVTDAKSGRKTTKAAVLHVLFNLGWCSIKSTGIEKSFLAALLNKSIGIPEEFAKLMGVAKTSCVKANDSGPIKSKNTEASRVEPPVVNPVVEDARVEDPNGFRLVNLKAVSCLTASGPKSTVSFIGFKNSLVGNIDVSALKAGCNLIEFSA